jgi:hypothetical protein
MAKKKLSRAERLIKRLRLKDLQRDAKIIVNYSTYSEGYRKGIEAAASFVEQFDKYVNHDYLLSECILSKFNVMKGKPRKNKRTHVIVGIWNR